MQFRIFCTCLFCIVLGASHVMAQTSLIGIWRAGDEFSYAIEDKNSISTGTDILNQSLKLDTNWHVKTVGVDGSAVITVTIERVRFKADQKGIPLSDNNKGKRQAKIAEQSGGGFVYFDEQTGRVIEATLRHQIAEESPYAPRLINTTILERSKKKSRNLWPRGQNVYRQILNSERRFPPTLMVFFRRTDGSTPISTTEGDEIW